MERPSRSEGGFRADKNVRPTMNGNGRMEQGMTLREALQKVDALHRESSLFVRVGEPLSLDSAVTVGVIPEEDDEPNSAAPPRLRLLMDVWHVAETMGGLEQKLKEQLGRRPKQQELFDRFMTYLKNDA